jgi:hypothetical protein
MREESRRPRPVAREQTARAVEDYYLHACRPRSSLIVHGMRSLNAALMPSIQTSAIVARGKARDLGLGEEREGEAPAGLGGEFCEPSRRDLGEDNESEAAKEEEEAWRADVEQELQALAATRVQEGLDGDDPFYISQLYIILDRTDALLEVASSRLRDGAYDPNHPSAHFLSR